jgi:sensor histidine kinase regulating citrate/malate metabolism
MSTQFPPHGRRSLRTRITLGMLLALVVTLWLATLLISHSLRQQMEATISAQQFSTVSLAAREVDRSVRERVLALQSLTNQFKNKPLTTAAIQPELLRRPILLMMFNWGVVVLDKNGMASQHPESLNRTGQSYANSAFFRQAMQHGGRYITEPMQGQHTGKPVISMLEPLREPKAKSWA